MADWAYSVTVPPRIVTRAVPSRASGRNWPIRANMVKPQHFWHPVLHPAPARLGPGRGAEREQDQSHTCHRSNHSGAIHRRVRIIRTEAAAPAKGNATAACKALAAWENGPATDQLTDDPARAKIAALGAGTKFGTDFNAWLKDSGDTEALLDAQKVKADCAAAGVPGVPGARRRPTRTASSAPRWTARGTVPVMPRRRRRPRQRSRPTARRR